MKATATIRASWEATADNTDKLEFAWAVPSDYRQDAIRTGERSRIRFRVKARKRNTGGASDNADLALTAQAFWHNSAFDSNGVETAGDTALGTLATARSNTLNLVGVGEPAALTGNVEVFRWYDFDLTAGMTDAQLGALKPGASMTIQLYPNEAVGTALAIDVAAIEVWYTGHLTNADRLQRDKAFG